MNVPFSSEPYVEPWLRGTRGDVPAVSRAVLHALDLAREDIGKWTDGLTNAEIQARPLGLPSIAFHLKHLARSADRLLTYAEGNQLSSKQLETMKTEQSGAETLGELCTEIETSFRNATERLTALATADFDASRCVGRKQLPTSVGGLLVHIADHTQRHVGQVVTTAKVLRAMRS